MAPTSIKCGFTGCEYKSEHESEQVALLQFQSHLASHNAQASTGGQATSQRLPPIERPILKQDINEEEWEAFIQEWKRFKICAAIPAGQIADQLFNCCETSLGRLILKESPNAIEAGEDTLTEAMKRMAVIKVATCKCQVPGINM